MIPLWTIPLALAVILRLITSRWSHPLIFPGYFLAIPIVFYAISFGLHKSVPDLREAGWVFDISGVDSKWYEYWTLFGTFFLSSTSPCRTLIMISFASQTSRRPTTPLSSTRSRLSSPWSSLAFCMFPSTCLVRHLVRARVTVTIRLLTRVLSSSRDFGRRGALRDEPRFISTLELHLLTIRCRTTLIPTENSSPTASATYV